MSTTNFLILLFAGLVSGFLNTLAGGGSLLTLPLFVAVGLGWESANATSRVAVLLQSVSAVWGFARHEAFPWKEVGQLSLVGGLGAIIGAGLTHIVDADLFKPLAVGLLIMVGLAMTFFPKFSTPSMTYTLREKPLAYPLLFVVGVYAGFLQAGVGYVLLAVFAGVLGRDLAGGNALKAALVLVFTVVALPVLGLNAPIDWAGGLTVGVGAMVGAQLAVRFAVKASPSTLRWILLSTLAVVIAVAAFE